MTVASTERKVIVDINCDHLFPMIQEIFGNGCKVERVKDLDKPGANMHSDYSWMKYAEKNGMIVISLDDEVIDACKENSMICVKPWMLRKKRAMDVIKWGIIQELKDQGVVI